MQYNYVVVRACTFFISEYVSEQVYQSGNEAVDNAAKYTSVDSGTLSGTINCQFFMITTITTLFSVRR